MTDDPFKWRSVADEPPELSVPVIVWFDDERDCPFKIMRLDKTSRGPEWVNDSFGYSMGPDPVKWLPLMKELYRDL